ncbi:hypothetical protein L5515_013639 [Caenorhabditis briggsae]|uniref:Bromodomain associated domain-containing protein n=2 Tax=Caenorhabditis briggsae TaxID=6238 RepID=A0AAE9J7B2_CAEBR|nr:hypothetical protein L5515_013639 [Caenorhabditis briggsae]
MIFDFFFRSYLRTMTPENAVLHNLRDSISRIVDNLHFTSIDEAAHARLVGLVADKLTTMGDTCRALLENSGRTGIGLNSAIDLKYLFKIHHVDLRSLLEYTQQVRPFPPKNYEIHGDESAAMLKSKKLKNENLKKPEKPKVIRHPTPPSYNIPIYDNMSPHQLGYNSEVDAEATPLIPDFPNSTKIPSTPPSESPQIHHLPPPPPPPPIPPIPYFPTSSERLFEKFIPIFDPIVPPPPVYTVPEPVVKLKIFKADPPLIYEPKHHDRDDRIPQKWPKFDKYRLPKSEKRTQKLEKTPSNASISGPKMTRKRLMQTNYERRLRNEQMAREERKKEKLLEKLYQKKEKERKQREEMERKHQRVEEPPVRKFKGRLPRLVLKVPKETLKELKNDEPISSGPLLPLSPKKDENHNLMISKSSKPHHRNSAATSSEFRKVKTENIGDRAPLLKMKISFRKCYEGAMIMKVVTTDYQKIFNGAWQPLVGTWQSRNGVYSKTTLPRRAQKRASTTPSSATSSKNLPKIKFKRNSDNDYSII